MSDTAIRVQDLSKQYRIGVRQEKYHTLRDTLVDSLRAQFRRLGRFWKPSAERSAPSDHTIWALKDVSFEIKQGEVVGIIGRNGAGKSTLLKILSRITEPTSGFAEIHGRVSSLLEVGTGFHQELTGRENIYLNGAILGMKRAEIERKFDEIVAFAEVERFIDTPVKHYSSGMYVRLAFAVAAHLEQEVLLVDEVLAVGDAAFQKKCLGKMGDVAKEGRTVLLVSHNMSAILGLCHEAILLDAGQLILRASSSEVVERYLNSESLPGAEKTWPAEEQQSNGGPFRPIAVRVRSAKGAATGLIRSSEPFSIEAEYYLTETVRDLRVQFKLYTTRGELLFISSDRDERQHHEGYFTRGPGRYVSRCHVPGNLLNGGVFIVGLSAAVMNVDRYFVDSNCVRFEISAASEMTSLWADNRGGFFRPMLQWEIESL